MTGPYRRFRRHMATKAVYTNKVPLGPYRGAGRPEAAMFIERMMDLLGRIEDRPRRVETEKRKGRGQIVSPLGLKRSIRSKQFLESAVKELGVDDEREGEKRWILMLVLLPAGQPGKVLE